MLNNLRIEKAPHVQSRWDTQKIMLTVFLALIPAAAMGVWVFGVNALWVIVVSLAASWVSDILCQYVSIKSVKRKISWSSMVTGLLLALVLPPAINPLFAALGAAISVVVGKYMFGIGNNIFNPALVGRTFLVLSFPAFMGAWIIPDAVTSATPLTELAENGYTALADSFGSKASMYSAMAIGNIGGCIGETSAIALLLGGLVLLALGIISWRIPAAYLGTVALVSFISGRDVLLELTAGGLILGAFFMATDYVTSPMTKKGKLVFGIGLGVLTMIFRLYSSMPEGVAFSILLMNALAPLIERFTMPRPFGK